MLIDSLINTTLNRLKGGNLGWLLTHSEELYADPMVPFAFRVYIPGAELHYTYVKSVDVPLPSHEVHEFLFEGRPMKCVSFMKNSDLTITFHEDEFGTVLKELEKWRIQQFNPTTGVYGLPIEYKKDIHIYTVDRDMDVGTQMIARGSILTSMNGYTFDTEVGNKATAIVAKFSIDAIYYSFTDKKKRLGTPTPFFPLGFLFGDMAIHDFSKGNWPWNK